MVRVQITKLQGLYLKKKSGSVILITQLKALAPKLTITWYFGLQMQHLQLADGIRGEKREMMQKSKR